MNRYSSQKRERTLVIRPDIATGYADLFGEKTVNGRSCSVEGLIVSLTRTIEADLGRLLTARREFLAQITTGKRRYGFADPAEEVEDADGKRLTAAQVRQGMVDNLLGRDTPYRWRLNAKTHAPAEVGEVGAFLLWVSRVGANRRQGGRGADDGAFGKELFLQKA